MSEAPQKRRFQFSIMVLLLAMGMVGVGAGLIRWGFAMESASFSSVQMFLIFFGCVLIVDTPFAVVGYGFSRRRGAQNALVWFIFFDIIAAIVSLFVVWIIIILLRP